ncbi:MAG TPA: hypothetical protein PKL08_04495, partial [Thermoanaerobaculaceae bacterium]|nr:hypothetical protein [Thermoanaerobaculaceae bacterium]
DSLGYLTEAGMLSCLRTPAHHFCTACSSGRYPVMDEDGVAEVMGKERCPPPKIGLSPAAHPALWLLLFPSCLRSEAGAAGGYVGGGPPAKR